MTLNITMVMPNYIIQVSDRRMVSVPSGKVYNDEANKGIVVKADDGIFSVIFAGIGTVGKQRVDLWLADQMLHEGIPELPVSHAGDIIASHATDWFNTFPVNIDQRTKRHTFTLAGWENSITGVMPVVWRVTNSVTHNDVSLELANDSFDAWKIPMHPSSAGVFVSGLCGAITRQSRQNIQAALRAHATPIRIEQVLVGIVQAAASNPQWAWGVNDNILSIIMDKSGEVQATHYAGQYYSRYVPPILWYEAGRDYIAGDAWITSSQNKIFQFGPMVFTAPPSNPTTQQEVEIDFHFKFIEAIHKQETPGDVSLIKAFDKK